MFLLARRWGFTGFGCCFLLKRSDCSGLVHPSRCQLDAGVLLLNGLYMDMRPPRDAEILGVGCRRSRTVLYPGFRRSRRSVILSEAAILPDLSTVICSA